jgi:hypothetical protein
MESPFQVMSKAVFTSENMAILVKTLGPKRYPKIDGYPLVNIQKNYGKLPCLMGKSTISMAILNSKLLISLPEGTKGWKSLRQLIVNVYQAG